MNTSKLFPPIAATNPSLPMAMAAMTMTALGRRWMALLFILTVCAFLPTHALPESEKLFFKNMGYFAKKRGDDPCSWREIECDRPADTGDADRHVVSIHVDGDEEAEDGKYYQIPDSIGNLRQLETLIMPHFHLSGKLPDEIKNCKKLTQIDLSFNRIKGVPDGAFGDMSQLKHLNLGSNRLRNEFKASTFFPVSLEFIDLSYNLLTGELPEDTPEHLNKIVIPGNHFECPLPDWAEDKTSCGGTSTAWWVYLLAILGSSTVIAFGVALAFYIKTVIAVDYGKVPEHQDVEMHGEDEPLQSVTV